MQDATDHTNEFDIYPEQALGGLKLESELAGELPLAKMSPDAYENRLEERGREGVQP